MNISLTTASIPSGFCPLTNEQWQTLVSLLTGTVNLIQGPVNKSITAPGPNQLDFPWLRLNNDGSPDRLYVFHNGLWLSRHAFDPGAIIIQEIAPGLVTSFDGGDGGDDDESTNPATPISGPMWYTLDELSGKFPVGAGTFPISGKVLSVNGPGTGTTGGVERHTLTIDEIPAHHHATLIPVDDATDTVNALLSAQASGSVTQSYTSGDTGGGQSHQNLPPYYTVRFLKKSTRIFYTVTP